MAQDGLVAFEPAFVDELAAIMRWSFEYMQRDGADNEDRHDGDDETAWLREKTGGSVYLRLSTRKIEQVQRPFDATLEHGAVMGGYWLRAPGPNCELVIVYQGAVAPEAIRAAGMIGNDRRDVAVLAVTSADRLSAGWHAARRARRGGHRQARAYVEDLLGALPPHAGLVTVIDGHPTTLSWLGGVTATGSSPWASSISANRAPSTRSIGPMKSTARRLSPPPSPWSPAGRSAGAGKRTRHPPAAND